MTDERENGERETRERELAGLLDYLHRSRGLDLSGYKRVGLLRRMTKRMRAVGVGGFGEYVEYLDTHPNEYTSLLDTLLINVTAFFRDDLPWEYLSSDIIPTLLAQKSPTEAIRVWCAGCASGEEAYTLAIVLAEALGVEAFQERVKLYGTDLDNDALAKARLGAYTERDLADVPPAIVEKYFDQRDQSFVFRKDLRRCVIFGRNDLVQDAPISRVDLLACRNTLMYFDGATQAKILTRFHFALNDGGFLFLGRAETMLTYGNMFVPVDLRRRIFTKARGTG
ncbi:MAG TPA: protein-glutamate O-methyltransferase CheR, partial [Gemmatimonadaceae bacterium]|nr:protein-glutamate O-methyltransferase CheR [Gemmatimonadaceae bacterium]